MRRWMLVGLVAVLPLAALALVAMGEDAAGAGEGKAYDLRGSWPPEGTVVVASDARHVAMGVTGEQVPPGMKMVADSQQTRETKLAKLVDGQPTRFETQYIKGQTQTVVVVNGQQMPQPPQSSPLVGKTVVSEKVEGQWKQTVDGQPLPANAAGEASKPWNANKIYPAEPVKPGHKWSVSGDKLVEMLGMPAGTKADGAITMVFEKVVERAGQPCAKVNLTMAVTTTRSGAAGPEKVTMKGTGTVYRSLTTHIDVQHEMTADMTVDAGASRGTGTMKATGTETIKKAEPAKPAQ